MKKLKLKIRKRKDRGGALKGAIAACYQDCAKVKKQCSKLKVSSLQKTCCI